MQTSETARLAAVCWSCGAGIDAFQPLCASCGKVQPPGEANYFDVFGLPQKLALDLPALEKTFYRYSRKLHPDLYAGAPEQEQQWSLAQASRLNDAYRTFKNPVERTKYLLKLAGVQFEDEQAGTDGNPSKVPADLLEEVFELNMQLEEMRMNRKLGEDAPELRCDLEKAKNEFAAQLDSVDLDLRSLWTVWDEALQERDESKKATAKEKMVALLQRRSYLQNLVRNVKEALGEQ